MYISVSKSRSFDPASHKQFTKMKCETLADFARAITESVWSPILWRNDTRLKSEFLSCKYAALDFDNGAWSLADAEIWCKARGLGGIIGTSKSHGIAKSGKPACDRFRLVIAFASVIVDREVYESNMRGLTKQLPCDAACVDAARFFYPCKAIVWRGLGGRLPVAEAEERVLPKADERRQLTGRMTWAYEHNVWPVWMQSLMAFGCEVGDRHRQVYRIAANFALSGMPDDEIVARIMKSPLGALGGEEVDRTARDGAAKCRQEAAENDDE